MKTQISLAVDAKVLDALTRFLGEFEKISPEPLALPQAILGHDNVVYVEAGYETEEDTFVVGDRMAEVGANIVEETGILVALAPFVTERTEES